MALKPVDTAIVMVVGPCIDDTDFKTLEEAIAYNAAGMDVSLIVEKTDGTSAVTAITLTTSGTSDWTHKDGGYYEVEITATQNAEEGVAYVRGVCTGVLPFESPRYEIVPANIYDSLVKGTDKLQVDAAEISGDSAAADNLELDYDGTGYTKTNSTIGTCTTNSDMRGTDSGALASVCTDTRLSELDAANLPTDIADIPTVAEFNARTLTAADYFDHSTDEVFADLGKIDGCTTLLTRFTDLLNNGYNSTTHKVQGVVLVDTVTANTDMRGTDSGALATALATVDSNVDAILVDTNTTLPGLINSTNILVDTTILSVTDQTHIVLAMSSDLDDVYNDQMILFYENSYTGNDWISIRKVIDFDGATKTVTLNSAPDFTVIATDHVRIFITPDISTLATAASLATVDGIVDDILVDTAEIGAAGAGLTALGDTRLTELEAANLPTDISNVKAETALIVADTNELQTDWVNGGRLDLILDACALEATVAALNNISTTDVNAQVSDVIKTDTISEMAQGVPPSTPTLEDAIMYLYMYFRNEVTQTSSTLSLKNDGGTVITKATVSDDATTFTKGEMVSGP